MRSRGCDGDYTAGRGEVATLPTDLARLSFSRRISTSRWSTAGPRSPTISRIAFRGPTAPPMLPKIKLDVTSDEVLVQWAARRAIGHPYSDQPLPTRGVPAYEATELAAEKIRALAGHCRPRDIYDVVHLHRHPDLTLAQRPAGSVGRGSCVNWGCVGTFRRLAEPRHRKTRPWPFRTSGARPPSVIPVRYHSHDAERPHP